MENYFLFLMRSTRCRPPNRSLTSWNASGVPARVVIGFRDARNTARVVTCRQSATSPSISNQSGETDALLWGAWFVTADERFLRKLHQGRQRRFRGITISLTEAAKL
jgi:hypothetical protein